RQNVRHSSLAVKVVSRAGGLRLSHSTRPDSSADGLSIGSHQHRQPRREPCFRGVRAALSEASGTPRKHARLLRPHVFAVFIRAILISRGSGASMAPNAVNAVEPQGAVTADTVRKRSLRYTG